MGNRKRRSGGLMPITTQQNIRDGPREDPRNPSTCTVAETLQSQSSISAILTVILGRLGESSSSRRGM
jgi:hypothetical protein